MFMTHQRTDKIIFKLNEFASKENNYDKSMPHRYGTEIVIHTSRETITLDMGTILSLIGIYEVLKGDGNPGPALDKLYELLRNYSGNDAVTKAINMMD